MQRGSAKRTPWWAIAVVTLLGVIAVTAIVLTVTLLNGPAIESTAGSAVGQTATVSPSPLPADNEENSAGAQRIAQMIAHPVLYTRCSPSFDDEVQRSDDGGSVVLVSHGYGLVSCTLKMLGAPDSVYARMEQTRPIDGMQSAEWDFVEVDWTFDGAEELRAVIQYTGPEVNLDD